MYLLGFAVHDAQGNQVIDVAEHLPALSWEPVRAQNQQRSVVAIKLTSF